MGKIIVNADDFGISSQVNSAIVQGIRRGLIDRATLIVNMDHTKDAVEIAKEYSIENRIGLHLNICEGIPLTEPIKKTIFCHENGAFCESTLKITKNRLYLDNKNRRALEIELRAQIEKYLSFGFQLKHVDSHEHTHTSISVWNVLEPLLLEYRMRTARLSRNIPESSIKGFNRIYKKYINHKISAFNGNKTEIDKFGSQDDVTKFLQEQTSFSGIELMIHPIMKDGKIVDIFNMIDIETWKKQHCIGDK